MDNYLGQDNYMSACMDYETYVIGALCLEKNLVNKITGTLSVDDFQSDVCRAIYQAAITANSERTNFDAIVAANSLSEIMTAIDAKQFVLEAMQITPTAGNIELHAEEIHKAAQTRALRASMFDVVNGTNDPTEIAASLMSICNTQLKSNKSKRLGTLGDAVSKYYGIKSGNVKEARIDTGYRQLDNLLCGMMGTDLILIAARPSVGKSALALDIAKNAAWGGHKTLFYSYEMASTELAERLIARDSRVDMDTLIALKANTGDAKTWESINKTCARLSGLPLLINDNSRTTVNRIRSDLYANPDIEIVFVDYITLMPIDGKYANRNLEVGAISRELKMLAQELKIPIIAVSQLNREADEAKRPKLSNLRDSGSLEQDANKILFLWRRDVEDHDSLVVSIAKNRRGHCGDVDMSFDGSLMEFQELESEYITKPKASKRRAYEAYADED